MSAATVIITRDSAPRLTRRHGPAGDRGHGPVRRCTGPDGCLYGIAGGSDARPYPGCPAPPGELILAACSAMLCVAATAAAVRRFRAGSAGSAETMLRIGLGFLAVGALGIAVGWLGLRVPTTPGTDFLERGEPLFIIDGVIAGAFGLLVTFLALVALGLRNDRRIDM
jgi:hypothetical protein